MEPRETPVYQRVVGDVRRCPACGGDVIRGGGSVACLDCGWVGIRIRRG